MNPRMTARLAGLIERLREQVDSGRRTLGGGSISHDGKGEMWGGEPIMVARNPDGTEAATAIEDLLARNAALKSALEPFAEAAEHLVDSNEDHENIRNTLAEREIACDHLRQAARTLNKDTANAEG